MGEFQAKSTERFLELIKIETRVDIIVEMNLFQERQFCEYSEQKKPLKLRIVFTEKIKKCLLRKRRKIRRLCYESSN